MKSYGITFDKDEIAYMENSKGTPLFYDKIQKDMQDHIDKGERLLIYKDDNTSPQNAIVMTLTSASKRFASGYTYSKLDDTKTPYTLNYSSLLDKSNKTFIKVEDK